MLFARCLFFAWIDFCNFLSRFHRDYVKQHPCTTYHRIIAKCHFGFFFAGFMFFFARIIGFLPDFLREFFDICSNYDLVQSFWSHFLPELFFCPGSFFLPENSLGWFFHSGWIYSLKEGPGTGVVFAARNSAWKEPNSVRNECETSTGRYIYIYLCFLRFRVVLCDKDVDRVCSGKGRSISGRFLGVGLRKLVELSDVFYIIYWILMFQAFQKFQSNISIIYVCNVFTIYFTNLKTTSWHSQIISLSISLISSNVCQKNSYVGYPQCISFLTRHS